MPDDKPEATTLLPFKATTTGRYTFTVGDQAFPVDLQAGETIDLSVKIAGEGKAHAFELQWTEPIDTDPPR